MAGRAALAGGGGRAAAWAGLTCLAAACAPADPAALSLTPVDTDTGAPTPTRIEVLDEAGSAHVASDALAVTEECAVAPLPARVLAAAVGGAGWRVLEAESGEDRSG